MYGGAAVVTRNLVREVGLPSFTEVAGAATFTADAYDKYEIVYGIGATDDDDETFGCRVASWEVPCKANPTVSAAELCCLNGRCGVIDDTAAGTSLTSTLFDPDDGNAITATSTIDIDAADLKNIRWVFSGVFEEAYGNPWCDTNIVTIGYNATAFDDMKLTDAGGRSFPTTSNPSHYTAVAGSTTKSYIVPAVMTNTEVTYYIVADADGTLDPTGTTTNITIYMYDGNQYQDNDVTPPDIKCGVEDEDAAQVGGSTDFSDIIYLEED